MIQKASFAKVYKKNYPEKHFKYFQTATQNLDNRQRQHNKRWTNSETSLAFPLCKSVITLGITKIMKIKKVLKRNSP